LFNVYINKKGGNAAFFITVRRLNFLICLIAMQMLFYDK